MITQAGSRIQRIGKEDKWCVECHEHLGIFELNRDNGQLENRGYLKAQGAWSLSADGGRLFAARKARQRQGGTAWECFDFKTGQSLWTLEDGIRVTDTAFTPDGTRIVILHDADFLKGDATPAISWHDAATGRRLRQIKLTGVLSADSDTRYLGVTNTAVYAAIPHPSARTGEFGESVHPPDAYVIRDTSDEPVPLDLGEISSRSAVQVLLGGENQELVAFHNAKAVVLFRETDGVVTKIQETPILEPTEWSFMGSVVFSPDHSRMMSLSNKHARLISTDPSSAQVQKAGKWGWRLGDFTMNGKFFVTFDDGGGTIHDPVTMERVDAAKLREHPVHCCPIEDAGFSTNGKWIISNDKSRLLLWSTDGRLLAELISPNEKYDQRMWMQSPVFQDSAQKIYAADGYDFVEWDIGEIARRVKRAPQNTPRVEGKVVFRSGDPRPSQAEVMDIGVNASGTKIVTGTRTTFRYHDIASEADSTLIQVPRSEIVIKPRSLRMVEKDSKILVKAGSDTFSLDPTGKLPAVSLSQESSAHYMPGGVFFVSRAGNTGSSLYKVEATLGKLPTETMDLPENWSEDSCKLLRATSDGKWIVLCRGYFQSVSSMTVIDWETKKVVFDLPLGWNATSLELSPDETQIIVGSFNRSVYVFDLKKIRSAP